MDNSLKILFLLNMADIGLTKWLTDLGATELNPIIRHLLSVNFIWALLFKVVLSVLFITIAIRLKSHVNGVRTIIAGANVVFAILVTYQVIGIAVLLY